MFDFVVMQTTTLAPVYPDVLSMIGNTPLLELSGFDTGLCRVFLKLENQNPTGSIKDRMALTMIEAAEKSGQLRPGGTIIEATAGNTGLGLALIAAVKGYHLILVIPDKMSREKISHLRAFGAEIRITRSDVSPGHPDFYQDLAARIASELPGSININQFANPANPRAHEEGTGPEIWEQMDHSVDAIVCAVGSGGTITGISRFFARVQPHAEIVLADPQGSALAEYVRSGKLGPTGPSVVEGIGGSTVPKVADFSRVHKAYTISDEESLTTARDLLAKTGILVGSSTGTLLAATLHYCREQTRQQRVVTFVTDSGSKYLSKMFNDYWMIDQGFIHRTHTGDLRDLITRRYEEGAVITVGPDDTLLTAFQRMRMADVSQVPVIENRRVVGILDESDVLMSVHANAERFHQPVRSSMTSRLQTLPPEASLEEVFKILDQGHVVLVMEHDHFLGLITRTDLINHLRQRLK